MLESYIMSFFPMFAFYRIGLSNLCLLLGIFLINKRLLMLVFLGKIFIPNLLLGTLFNPIFIMGSSGTSLALFSMITVFSFKRSSFFLISVSGALAHNLGQCIILFFFMPYMLSLKLYGFMMLNGLISGSIIAYISFELLKRMNIEYYFNY